MAPLLDPYKYLIGKYNINDTTLFSLPKINSTHVDCHSKYLDTNNSAYVDGLFLYLTSNLMHTHNFLHGVDYYGSFLGVKNNFIINVFDDLDYLNNSDFFNKHKNILFKIDNYQHLIKSDDPRLPLININHDGSAKSQLSIKSLNEEIFENIFEDTSITNENILDLVDLENFDDITSDNNDNHVTLKSNSSCSSRTSYTDEDNSNDNFENDTSNNSENRDNNRYNNSDNESYMSENEEIINVSIPQFPIQLIAMECCENTFDNLILDEELTSQEWYSAFMQIIMILITYQKAFHFTHNDLHTNNVMYNQTSKKYIYYCYKKKYYKVPTFGRIFKIIDFGRSIYKFDGKLFCSDSFQTGGDAATQYNTEPYLNDKKPRLEPNFSFDLCRLACSIFDYVIEDFEEIKNINTCQDPIKRLICEWCSDDKGINMLYKNNGSDRYPDFKLYKMIARCVHNHTPQAQLERPEFDSFSNFIGEIPNDIINIDEIPCYF
jgi:hypothetical protein